MAAINGFPRAGAQESSDPASSSVGSSNMDSSRGGFPFPQEPGTLASQSRQLTDFTVLISERERAEGRLSVSLFSINYPVGTDLFQTSAYQFTADTAMDIHTMSLRGTNVSGGIAMLDDFDPILFSYSAFKYNASYGPMNETHTFQLVPPLRVVPGDAFLFTAESGSPGASRTFQISMIGTVPTAGSGDTLRIQ